MTLVRLDKRHSLFKSGYTHAFRFWGFTAEASQLEKALNRIFGSEYPYPGIWCGRYGSRTNSSRSNRTYWVGLKDESMATVALLSL